MKAQTNDQKKQIVLQTNEKELLKIAATAKDSFFKNKMKAYEFAKKFNWPIRLFKNDTYSELIGVTKQNLPLYYTTSNNGAGVTSRANKLYTGGSLGLNINGENMTAGVWDAAAGLTTHELFSGRLQVLDGTTFTHPHSSHVAGTIMGTDLVQNALARGMAYRGNVNSYDWTNDVSEVATAAGNGLLFSNHSYGMNPAGVTTAQWGKYNTSAQSFDEIMFNAPFFQFVCAAGNSRGNFNTIKNGYDVISGHGLSKNGITVAAVNEVLNYTGPNSVIMSSFSSWGPTDDGRIKPDISAKGVNTYSAFDTSNTSYGTYSGTSMASPSVVGTLMLYQQYYNQLNGNFMKAATVKGLMIHTADEAGATSGPDYSFGWGLINAEKAANVITKNQTQSLILENTLSQGNSYSTTVNAIGTEPLVATICWTDPKGDIPDNVVDSSVAELINDLDIRITQNTTTVYPWKLDVANPSNAATRGDNIVDNVEKAEIENPTGSYTITVSHKGTLLNNSQNYSLIISGINVKDYWFTTNQRSQAICQSVNTANYNFNLFTKTNFNQTITFSTTGLPASVSATFTPSTMTAAGTFGLQLSNLTTLTPGTYPFIVKASTISDLFEMPIAITILTPTFQNAVLQQPANNANSINIPTIFNWQADINAQQYDIQIATDAAFNTIINSATVNTNTYTYSNLLNNTTYFWRVKPKNSCGIGDFSNPNSFTTVCALPTNILQVSATTTSASISWTENSGATTWYVEYVPVGTTPTGIGTLITTNPYVITGLNSNTCYDFYIKSNCGTGTSSWTNKTRFCTQPNYCGGDHFVDSGGTSGNYANNENITTTIFPSNTGNRVKAVFNSFNIENGWDYLRVYNGPNTSSPLLYTATGTTIPAYITSTHSTGALTFVFTSDGVVTSPGWDATIICEPIPACPVEPNNLILANLTYNSARIDWTENTGATSWNVEVVPFGTNPTGIGTLTTSKPHTLTGLLPNTKYNFYVRSNCSAGTSGWSIPLTFITPGNYCAGDHFYDDGGATGNYTQNYFIQTIYPNSAGNRIKAIFNSFQINNYDNFYVFNGTNTNAPILYASNGTNTPGTLRATNASGALTFVLYAQGFNNQAGWDATIVCEPMPPCPNPPSNIYTYSITTTTATFNWYENSGATSWEVEIVPQGTTPTGIGTIVTSNPYTKTGLLSNTWYDFYVRSRCSSGNSDWSLKTSFNTLANYCAGDHFYDNGGPNQNYQQYQSQYVTIYPTTAGNRVKATFNSFQLNTYDSFSVYDGGNLIFSRDSSNPISPTTPLVATNPQGTLSFNFYPGSSATNTGWDATIVCEPLPPCSNPPSYVYTYSITTTTATFSWQENSNATSWEIEIVPQGTTPTGVGTIVTSNPYTKTGLLSNTWYDFYVRSKCGNVNSTWTQKTPFNTLANYCAGDHFYDNGGPNQNYQQYQSQYVTIYPTTTGNRVKATFNSFQLNNYDSFYVYDGNTLIFSRDSSNPISPTTTLVATNPQGSLSFYFSSNSSTTNTGWDATIVCEPLPPCSNPPSYVYTYSITTTTATFSWQENSNATSWEIEIVPQGTTPTGVGTIVTSNPYTKTGLLSNTWYDFYVRSKCGNVNSTWTQKTPFNTLANYCAGDHFYDNGGPNQNYLQYSSQYGTITPTGTGNRVKATFNSFQLNNYDSFYVYDGNTLIFSRDSSNPISPTTTLVATNPQGTLSYNFYSGSSATNAGWDATIVCEPLPPCSSPPSYVYVYGITTTTATFSWQENSNATSWEIEIVPQGTTPTGVGTIVTSNPYTKTGLLSNTWYDFYVRSKCGNVNSTWTQKAPFVTLANYCAGDHFYDNGGPNQNYQQYSSQYVTIYPTGTGNRVKATFNSFQLNNYDSFYVYDGNTLIFSRSSSNPISPTTPLVATNPQGTLSFNFYSGSSTTSAGWDATIVCEPMPPCTLTPTNVTFTNILMDRVTINWTDTSSVTSWEIEKVLAGGVPTGSGTVVSTNPYILTGLTSNTCYDIYIRSICGNQHSNWTTYQRVCSQPNFCGGDHFYDSGGASGYYQNGENITTVIYPNTPTGKVKATFNSFQTESGYDYLYIYNGPNTAAPLLYTAVGSTLPGTYTSTHATGALTFRFISDGSVTYSGWDATIECIALGINDQEIPDDYINYSPNPVIDILRFESKIALSRYELYDINSRILSSHNIDNESFTINLEAISSGIYFIKLFDFEDKTKFIKIIKK